MSKSLPTAPTAPSVSVGTPINSDDVSLIIINKITEYSPYICILLAILLIISLVTQVTSGSSDSEPIPTYSGNKSLDALWTDAKGNDISSDARMTSQVSLSTNEYSCKFDVTYEGEDSRDVTCISGCSVGPEPSPDAEEKENEEFCNQYRYSAEDDQLSGTMLSKFLDAEYMAAEDLSDTPVVADSP